MLLGTHRVARRALPNLTGAADVHDTGDGRCLADAEQRAVLPLVLSKIGSSVSAQARTKNGLNFPDSLLSHPSAFHKSW